MQDIPKNYYRYKQLPIWDNESIPKGLLGVHNTKKGVYGKIHVLEGNLKYTIFESEGGDPVSEIIVPAGEYGIAKPQQWHSVEPIGKVKMQIDFYGEMPKEIQELEKKFHEVFPDKNPHYEVMYLVSLLDKNKHKTALDVGCGGGRNSLFLSENSLKVTSIDKNFQALMALSSLANEHNLNISVSQVDLNKQLINEDFDVMIATVSLQFLEPESASDLLNSMQNHTNIGGYNLIIVPVLSDDVGCIIDFPNMREYSYYLDLYKDWEIIHTDNYVGRFHKKDENGKFIKSRFATIIAKKK